MADAVGELIEAVDYLMRGLAGWRYVLSTAYRRQVHQRWRLQSRLQTSFEIIGYLLGISFTIVVAALLVNLAR
jgi:hypothetical protein